MLPRAHEIVDGLKSRRRNGRAGIRRAKVLANITVEAECRSELRRVIRGTQGQALIELSLMVPLLFLLIVNVVNFGGFLYAWLTVANAARTAANYATLGSSSPGSPSSATTAQITSVITADTSSLPNTVSVCVNKNTTTTAATGTCSFAISSIPADPDGSPYVSLAVDVSYTYTPFIPLFSFPGLGIYATLPPTSLHRRAVMRVLS